MLKRLFYSVLGLLAFLSFTTDSFAHEAYVLSREDFQNGLKVNTQHPFTPLIDPSHWQLFLTISIIVAISYIIVVLFSTTGLSRKLDKVIRKLAFFGPLTIRIVISASFLFSAMGNEVLGPELSLKMIPGGEIIRILLFILSATILTGFLVELSAVVAFLIFIYITFTFGPYMATYLNYLGEIIVLMLFGSRFLSLDKVLFGKNLWLKGLEKFKGMEIPIVRIMYGLALIYAGLSIKFFHQNITVEVYNQYHLKRFFHETAQFIAAGAGLSEIMIGVFIMFGFVMRFTIIISLVFITLSLLYFRELVWPHLMLYGISISLIINSADKFTIDRYFIPWLGKMLRKIKTSV